MQAREIRRAREPHGLRRHDCRREALVFVQKVGELAEAEGHHPDIGVGWGYWTVSLRTKKIKGLHENDFIMATKIDRLASMADKNSPFGVPLRQPWRLASE
jgi:Pterin 4 alpha carbinolamine dehydratase